MCGFFLHTAKHNYLRLLLQRAIMLIANHARRYRREYSHRAIYCQASKMASKYRHIHSCYWAEHGRFAVLALANGLGVYAWDKNV